MDATQPVPKGLGGWLILPIINLVLAIPALLFVFTMLRVRGHPLVPLDVGLLVATAYCCVCLVAIFQKRKLAIYLMIAFYCAALLVTLSLLATVPEAVRTGLPGGYIAPAVRSALELAVILYFLRSKRVKNTLEN
jgi:hypothetical protein